MSTETPARTGGNPRRGLRGSLDLPQDAIGDPGHVELSGWVFHANAEILLVVVTADGRVVATAERDIRRPDVAAAHPAAPQMSGWTAGADLGSTGAEVALEAHALVRMPAGEDGRGRTVLVPFAERTLPVEGGGVVRGAIDLPDEVAPGVLLVGGTADITPALSRVDVSVGQGPAVPARTSLPAGGGVDGFSARVEVPAGVSEVTVTATVTATDGTRATLPPRTVRVTPAAAPEPGLVERQRALAYRLEQYVAALRPVAPARRRVLVAAHDLRVGGAQNYLDELMRGLHAAEIELCVVAGSSGPLLDRIERDFGAPVLVVGPPPLDAEQLATRVRLVAGFALEHGATACLANTLVTFPAVLAAKAVGIPSAWAIHESFAPEVFWHEYLSGPADPAVLAGTREALLACRDVVFEAATTRALYTDLVSPDSSSLVPYGVDAAAMDAVLAGSSLEQARAELGLPADELALVSVGMVEPRKGQLALARAFARIDPSRRAGVGLHLVGAGETAYAHALRDFVAAADLTSVRVVDVDPDITRWYAAADVLVSASDVESMPRTMLEAMVAGRPVAATDAFGVGELVTDGATGFLCEPLDLAALQRMLERVVATDRSRLAAMGRAARAHVLEAHDPAIYVDHFRARLASWLQETGR